MNYKQGLLSIALVAGMGLFALTSGSVLAYQGDYTAQGPNHTPEREAAMVTVMTNNDYDGWKKLMTEAGRTPGVLRKVDTQEEFLKFAEAYRLGKAGKATEAAAIRAELGLGNGGGQGQGRGGHGGSFVDANGNGTCDRME